MPYRLDLVDGLKIVKSFPIEGDRPARVGRSAQNSIRLNDDRVSRRHCVLTPKDGSCVLTDLGSHNGTKVNGQVVGEQRLEDGDQIVVGNTMLIFRSVTEPPTGDGGAVVDTGEMTQTMATGAAAPPDPLSGSVVKAVLRHRDSRFLNADLLDAIPGDERRTAELLKALYKVTSSVLQCKSITELLEHALDLVFETLPVERATILLAADGELAPRATKSKLADRASRAEVSQSIAKRCFSENVAILCHDAQSDARFADKESIVMHGVRSAMCVPIGSASRTWGVLYVDRKSAVLLFNEEQLDFLLALARQVGLSIENLHLHDESRKTFESLIRTLAASIDAKDPVTAGHSDRVAMYAMALADRLGLPREEKRILRLAAYLHDYGKIGIRDAVLLKPARLTAEEFEEIKQHPRYTGEILGKIHFAEALKDVPLIAKSHHERVDGTGYPLGLKADQIPLGSKIIAIADVWDALTSPRQYKRGWGLDDALAELGALKGKYLDPELVDVFARYVEDELRPLVSAGQPLPKARKGGAFDTDEMAAPAAEGLVPKEPDLW